MGVRLETEASGFYGGDTYKIQIIDTDYAGAVIPFKTKLLTSKFNYNGVAKSIFDQLKTTEFNFNIQVTNSDHVAFWTAMAGQAEERFFCIVSEEVAPATYENRFIGHVVMDETLLQNTSKGRSIDLKAADGLYRLSDQEFKSETAGTDYFGNVLNDIYAEPTEYYNGWEEILFMVIKCLQGVGTLDHYNTGEPFLLINVDFYESMMSTLTKSPLEMARIRHEIFTERTEEGDYFTMTRAEVLRKLLAPFNAFIWYSWGTYIIESIGKRGDNSKTFHCYDKVGTQLSDVSIATAYHNIPYPFASNHYVNAEGNFGFVPPLKKACVIFNYNIKNYGAIPNSWNNDNTDLLELGDVIIEDEQTAIHFTSLIRYTPYDTGVPNFEEATVPINIYFGVKIKFGSYWWVTEVTNVGIPDTDPDGNGVVFNKYNFQDKWSAVEDTYKILVKQQVPWSAIKDNEYQVTIEGTTLPLRHIYSSGTTPAYNIEDVEALSVSIEFVKVAIDKEWEQDYIPGNPGDSELTGIDVEWRSVGALFHPTVEGEAPSERDVAIKVCVENNKKNSTIIEKSIVFGDVAFNSNNNIEIHDGADWVPSGQDWAIGALTGGGGKLQDLLLNEMAAAQPYTLQRYLGSFRGMKDNRLSLRYDSINYVPFYFTYGLYYREWDGEFYEAVRAPQSLTVITSGLKAETGGTLSTSGQVGTGAQDGQTSDIFPFAFAGADSREISFGDIPLPEITNYTTGQLNYLCVVFIEGARIRYGVQRVDNQFTIDNSTNKIILGRQLRSGQVIWGHIKKLIS